MRTYLQYLQIACLLVFPICATLAQTPLSGKVMSEQNEGIPGVTVSIRVCLSFCFTNFSRHDSYHCPVDKGF